MARTKKTEVKLTDKELEAVQKIKEYKRICESNVVAILYKNPELFYTYELSLEDFIHNEFKVFFQIGQDIICKEGKKSLDEITIGLYLEKHPKLSEKYYEEYGGYESISKLFEYVEISNIEGYINENIKWNTIFLMVKERFPIAHKIKEFVDMNTEEIYELYESMLNHIFINTSSKNIGVYDIADGLSELIDELNEGAKIGLPFKNLDLYTQETNGAGLGDMLLFLATSGAGKSSFIRSCVLPSILELDEKICFMVNEEDEKKQKTELLTYVCNNILNKPLQKHILNNGNFSKETLQTLKEAKEWIEKHKGQVIIVTIDSFTVDKAIKIISKYSSAFGIKYFVLDTFKHDASASSKDTNWLDLQLNAVKLFDCIKKVNKNVSLICTMQLTKQSTKQRYLTLDNVSSAKNVVDVCSNVTMFRWLMPDEYEGETHEVKCYKTVGKNTKIPVKLDKNKRYQIVFMPKNRYGRSNEFQIVLEVDLSKNTYKECGICYLTPDF